MTTKPSKVIIHMVSSLDGFITKKDGTISWMQSTDHYENGTVLTVADIADFLKSIDCYVMGSQTYEQAIVLGWPYGDKPVFVLTHRNLTIDRENVAFYSGDLAKFINDQLRPIYQNIWMVGGSKLTKDFLRLNLADKIILSIIPIVLGGGTLFFDYIGMEQKLHLQDVKAYKDGMVELVYELVKE